MLCWDGPVKGLYLILLMTLSGFMMTSTKLLLHDPRPYMVDDRINAKSCYHEYGNPSGHSVMAAVYPIFVLLACFHTEK